MSVFFVYLHFEKVDYKRFKYVIMMLNTRRIHASRWGFAVLLAGLWLAAGASVAEAQVEVKRYAENRKSSASLVGEGQLVGWHAGMSCWVGGARGGRTQVVWMDSTMTTVRQTVVPVDKDCRLLSAAEVGGEVRLLFELQPDRKHTAVYAARVGFDTAAASRRDTVLLVDTFTYQRKDRCLVWAAASPNGRYQAVVSVVELHSEGGKYVARVRLLDEGMQSLWTKEYALQSIDHVAVTDRGEVVTLGHEWVEDANHVLYNIASKNREDAYDVVVEGMPIVGLQLVGVAGRHVMAMGTIVPMQRRVDTSECAGVIGLAFDIDEVSLSVAARRFEAEDLYMLTNKKGGSRLRGQTVEYGSLLSTTLMPWGAVAALGCNYAQSKTENNGTTTAIYYRRGIHLVAVDTAGEVRWVCNLRRNDVQKKSADLLRVAVVPVGDRVWLLRSEHKKMPSPMEKVKPAKTLKMGGKSHLALYQVGEDGGADRLLLEQNTKHSLLRAAADGRGRVAIFTAKGKRLRMMAAWPAEVH